MTSAEYKSFSSLPLREGDRGEAVLDLQLRLGELDLACSDAPGQYGAATVEAVRQFQTSRGLTSDGVCDRATWSALVEAGYSLGGRLLYRHAPMLRGDDVGQLQRQLSSLGFDPGRIDGIFGDQTATALMDFQRNAGLPVDGRCGRETLAQLIRISTREGGSDLVTPLRERLKVASGTTALGERRFAVGEQGGFSHGVAAIGRSLRELGARALELHDPNPSVQALEANTVGVDVFVNLRILPEQNSCSTAYYSGFQYESEAAKHLASLIQDQLAIKLGLSDGGICGMALPILRETRMPAVEIQLGSPAAVNQRTALLARVVVDSLLAWLENSST